MIYWIENIKDGSFVVGAKTYEEALTIQDKKWKEEGIDTYIRKESNMEEENKKDTTNNILTKEELVAAIKSIFKENEEGLKFIDNIMSNLVEPEKLDNSKDSASFKMWMIFLMFLFGMHSFEQPLWNVEPSEDKEDETN